MHCDFVQPRFDRGFKVEHATAKPWQNTIVQNPASSKETPLTLLSE